MTAMTDYLEKKLLDHVFRGVTYTPPTTVYLALFTAAPSDAGGGTEVTGGSYARQSITFAAAVSPAGTISNSAVLNFASMPAANVTYGAIFDAATGGNMLIQGSLVTARTTVAGDSISVAIGDITLTFA